MKILALWLLIFKNPRWLQDLWSPSKSVLWFVISSAALFTILVYTNKHNSYIFLICWTLWEIPLLNIGWAVRTLKHNACFISWLKLGTDLKHGMSFVWKAVDSCHVELLPYVTWGFKCSYSFGQKFSYSADFGIFVRLKLRAFICRFHFWATLLDLQSPSNGFWMYLDLETDPLRSMHVLRWVRWKSLGDLTVSNADAYYLLVHSSVF